MNHVIANLDFVAVVERMLDPQHRIDTTERDDGLGKPGIDRREDAA